VLLSIISKKISYFDDNVFSQRIENWKKIKQQWHLIIMITIFFGDSIEIKLSILKSMKKQQFFFAHKMYFNYFFLFSKKYSVMELFLCEV
jgi:hypothetical protein